VCFKTAISRGKFPLYLMQAGFEIEQMESGHLATFPKSLTYCWWGTCVSAHLIHDLALVVG
jgi:hypothetical protein